MNRSIDEGVGEKEKNGQDYTPTFYVSDLSDPAFQKPEISRTSENLKFAPKSISSQYFAPILNISNFLSYSGQNFMPTFYVSGLSEPDRVASFLR